MSNPLLFQPLRLRDTVLKNRIVISPMGTYAARDGLLTDWHLVHQAQFAQGGAALVFTEATAVSPSGRATIGCAGLWCDEQMTPMRRIVDMLHRLGALAGLQLGHSGPKAPCLAPWEGNRPVIDAQTGWQPMGPTAQPWGPGWPTPRALTASDLADVVEQFAAAARRADAAGYDVLELHGAHGYLLHSFLSPLSNTRDDEWGGDLENRMRFPLQVTAAVRAAWPAHKPLFWRISAVDGVDIGWRLQDSVRLASELRGRGVDVIDCSSGGMHLPRGASLAARAPGFQVPFSAAVRRDAHIATQAVGLIVEPHQAEDILQQGAADLVALGREALHNPFWPLHAAQALGAESPWSLWPQAYGWWLQKRAVSLPSSASPTHREP